MSLRVGERAGEASSSANKGSAHLSEYPLVPSVRRYAKATAFNALARESLARAESEDDFLRDDYAKCRNDCEVMPPQRVTVRGFPAADS